MTKRMAERREPTLFPFMNTSYHARGTVSAKKHQSLRVQLHTVVAPEFLFRNDGLAQCRGESHLRLTSARRVRICSGLAFERLDRLFISHVVLSSGNGRRSRLSRVKNRRVGHVCFPDLAWEPRLSSARERGGNEDLPKAFGRYRTVWNTSLSSKHGHRSPEMPL